jgi:hypothetical protein
MSAPSFKAVESDLPLDSLASYVTLRSLVQSHHPCGDAWLASPADSLVLQIVLLAPSRTVCVFGGSQAPGPYELRCAAVDAMELPFSAARISTKNRSLRFHAEPRRMQE